jgi:hypothetical protein
MHNLKENPLEATLSVSDINSQMQENSTNSSSENTYVLFRSRTAKSMLKKFKLLSLAFIFLSIALKAQTPQTPIINYATQYFPSIANNGNTNQYRLVISQNISPRVFKALHPSSSEIVKIMFIGNWLDITDEVVVTGPGVNSPRGVTAGIPRGGNKRVISTGLNAIYPDYTGAYTIVEFNVASDATVGTHTVRLRRPRFGVGKDETVFYIEVYDAIRIHSIRFSNGGATAQYNTSGFISIKGDNLDRITSIGNCGGLLSNISNFQKTNKLITFNATLVRRDILNYEILMNSVTPSNLKNVEYPTQLSGLSLQRHWLKVE